MSAVWPARPHLPRPGVTHQVLRPAVHTKSRVEQACSPRSRATSTVPARERACRPSVSWRTSVSSHAGRRSCWGHWLHSPRLSGRGQRPRLRTRALRPGSCAWTAFGLHRAHATDLQPPRPRPAARSGAMAQPPASLGKLIAVSLYRHKGTEVVPVCMGLAAELSSFGYFQRGSVKEMITFLSRTIVQRTQPGGQRQRQGQGQGQGQEKGQGWGAGGGAGVSSRGQGQPGRLWLGGVECLLVLAQAAPPAAAPAGRRCAGCGPWGRAPPPPALPAQHAARQRVA